jgi:hypothetical protein
MPQRIISSLEGNIAILREFKESGKLTAQQLAVLASGEALISSIAKN